MRTSKQPLQHQTGISPLARTCASRTAAGHSSSTAGVQFTTTAVSRPTSGSSSPRSVRSGSPLGRTSAKPSAATVDGNASDGGSSCGSSGSDGGKPSHRSGSTLRKRKTTSTEIPTNAQTPPLASALPATTETLNSLSLESTPPSMTIDSPMQKRRLDERSPVSPPPLRCSSGPVSTTIQRDVSQPPAATIAGWPAPSSATAYVPSPASPSYDADQRAEQLRQDEEMHSNKLIDDAVKNTDSDDGIREAIPMKLPTQQSQHKRQQSPDPAPARTRSDSNLHHFSSSASGRDSNLLSKQQIMHFMRQMLHQSISTVASDFADGTSSSASASSGIGSDPEVSDPAADPGFVRFLKESDPVRDIVRVAKEYQNRHACPLSDAQLQSCDLTRNRLSQQLQSSLAETLYYHAAQVTADHLFVNYEQVQGLTASKETLQRLLIDPMAASAQDETYAIPGTQRSAAFLSLPGSGIRTLIKAACQKANVNLIVVRSTMSENGKLSLVLAYASLIQPCVVLFDRCDDWFNERPPPPPPPPVHPAQFSQPTQPTHTAHPCALEMAARLEQLGSMTNETVRVWLMFSLSPESRMCRQVADLVGRDYVDESRVALTERQNSSLLLFAWRSQIARLYFRVTKTSSTQCYATATKYEREVVQSVFDDTIKSGPVLLILQKQRSMTIRPGALCNIVTRIFDAAFTSTGTAANIATTTLSNGATEMTPRIKSRMPTPAVTSQILDAIASTEGDSIRWA